MVSANQKKQAIGGYGDHAGPLFDSKGGREIIECVICGFKHVTPLPRLEALQETYRREYYRDEKPDYLTHASADYDWASLAYQDRLEIFKEHLGANQRKLLDVGSGPGFFIKYASENGWDAQGVEPSAQAAQHTRDLGLAVTEDFFGIEIAESLGAFDVVNMNNMLEHVPNPRDLLEAAASITPVGGLVCVSVPNDYNPLQEILRDEKGFLAWWIAPDHHLNYFTFDSISTLMASVGLRTVSRSTSFPMELFLLMGDDYVSDGALGRACHEKRKAFDLALQSGGGELRREIYKSLAKLGIGREAILIGQKAADL
jgi:SAM-dependent methyltransferase